jgi:hypothetical protein
MNDSNSEQFEAELQTLRLAKPPQRGLNRILSELPSLVALPALPATQSARRIWIGLLRFLVPAGAVTILLASWVVQDQNTSTQQPRPRHLVSSPHSLLRADKIEIDRQLVADFDAVGKLPSGEPVRFRCQQWMEKVSLRDTAKGLVIEQTTPHLEIVPIRFETE